MCDRASSHGRHTPTLATTEVTPRRMRNRIADRIPKRPSAATSICGRPEPTSSSFALGLMRRQRNGSGDCTAFSEVVSRRCSRSAFRGSAPSCTSGSRETTTRTATSCTTGPRRTRGTASCKRIALSRNASRASRRSRSGRTWSRRRSDKGRTSAWLGDVEASSTGSPTPRRAKLLLIGPSLAVSHFGR
jgi:hypothetical protein